MLLEGSNASTVLTWVRPDLDKHLNQVRSQIEHIAKNPIIGGGIENAAEKLLQLKFTFEALVLQGATLVVEEMITVCEQLRDSSIRDQNKAFGALLDAIVVLPSYLDRLQAGHHDLPVLLLPVINELRAAHDANIVSEATLFTPSLDVPLPELEHGADAREPAFDEPFQEFALRMRRQWENALLRWLQVQDKIELLSPLHSVCETLYRRLDRMDLRRVWWIASEVIGGLLDGVTDNDMNLRRLFARLHLILKTLSEGGEEAVDVESVDALSQALLFHIAQAKSGSAGVDNLRERFRLEELVPDRDVLIRARGAVTGRNRELYKSLGAAVRDELSLVKDALDLELRTGEIEPQRREQSHEALLRLKDTLKMMGLGDSAQSIDQLMPAFEASETPGDDPEKDSRKALLMDLAGELIRVESDLEEQIVTLGEPLQEDQEPSYIDLPRHEQRRIHTHLLDETVVSLHMVQDQVRRHFDGEKADFISPMEHIAGAIELIGEKETALLALKLRNALGNLLRKARSETAVERDKLECVTDAVAAFELYLAGCRDQQSNRGRFLEILKNRLEHLPVGEMEVVRVSHQLPEEEEGEKQAETTEASGSSVPTAIDPELLGVFQEEYESVAAMFSERVPEWVQNQANTQLLTEIRRGFHTIKGSGRMVGAYELGDFAWQIENMLNALLEGNIQSTDDVALLIQLSTAAMPAMKERLLQQPSELGGAGIEAITQQVNAVTAGKKPDWAGLGATLPSSIAALLPGGPGAAAEEPGLKDLICKELAANLSTLKGWMDKISRDRNVIASSEEIHAAHSIAGTTALDPLGRESDIAKALEKLLEMQCQSGKPFTSTAIWIVATSLAYLDSCLAVHEGDPEAELAGDEESQIEQLTALVAEYKPAKDTLTGPADAESDDLEDLADDDLADIEDESVDTEILNIFLEEATDILERCDSLLNTWRDDLPDLDIVRSLQREFHTFKGGSRMAGLSAMGTLSHTMETLMEQIAGQLLQPSIAAIELLEQSCDRLNIWTEESARGEIPQAGEVLKEFEQKIEALTKDVEPPESTTDETSEKAQAPESADVEAPPATEEQKPETAEPSPEQADADAVSEQPAAEVAEPATVEPEPSVEDEVTETAGVEVEAESGTEEEKPVPAETVAAPEVPARIEPVVEELRDIPDVVVPTGDADAGTASGGESTVTQHIRVNADLLDSLVNSAGEISIFRSLLEQQIVQMREHLKEFDVTTSRLREQFRKLEIETETQIRSRYQQELPAESEEFDPLEMDRFSSMQQLSRSLSESVSDLMNLQELLDDTARKSDALLVQQSRVSSELQEGLMQTRMVHFGTIAPRLRRIIRTAASETRKKARLTLRMTGGGDQLDRNVLERITAPLEHLLRNSIVHGIEKPAIRRKLKKPAEGQLSITVAAEATEFVIRVEDDGAGVDLKAIHKRAIEMSLVAKQDEPQPQQLLQLILHSGFSTSKKVTALAGRGVGMDVVNSEIKQIGGSVELDSVEGQGSCFTIRIPFTLAVMQAIGIMAGVHRYMIPVVAVAGVARILPSDYQALLKPEKPVYEFAGELYPILELEPLLGEPATPLGDETISLLMIKAGDQRAAFRVSELLGHREIVIKPVGPQISSVAGILGATVTGEGQVVIIIDMGPLIRQALLTGARPAPPMKRVDVHRHKTLAMVVDDSITMRKVTTRVLENNNYEVVTARDGVDATEQMQDRAPDLIILDVEMPRMDGYQVAEYTRADARLRHIPIIMVTSRAGKKHRDRGIKAGANAYLSKPYKESELLKEVERLLAKGEKN